MSFPIFSYSLIIKEHHLDTFGHVNNATYLSLFEEARWEIMNSNNYGVKKIQATGLGPTILEIKINFLKELRLLEQIEIKTQVISHNKKITTLEQKIFRDEELCCCAEFIMGFFSLHERRLVLPTQEWLHTLGIREVSGNNA